MLCSGLYGEHAEYTSSTANVEHSPTTEQVLVVVHCVSVGERPHLVLQHFLVDAWCEFGDSASLVIV